MTTFSLHGNVHHSIFLLYRKRKELMESIQFYKPTIASVSQARVLLIGAVGAGKSSFFNSVNSVFRGHVTSQAIAGCSSTSLTTQVTFSLPLSLWSLISHFVVCNSFTWSSTVSCLLFKSRTRRKTSANRLVRYDGIGGKCRGGA